MCESVDIRFVHYMEHPDFAEILAVGCICAEHMEEDYVVPKQRERRLKAIARRRLSWGRRKWRSSGVGDFYLNSEGYNLTIHPDDEGNAWKVAILHRGTGQRQEGKRLHPSIDAAQSAALDALLWAKERVGSQNIDGEISR